MTDPDLTRVLVVDDDPDDFAIIEALLKDVGGYDVSWASQAGEGLEKIEEGIFDAVLVDHRLGAETGLELIAKARESGGAPPLIVVTGVANESVDRDAARLGAADYLVKTGLTDQILDRSIRYAISQRNTVAELEASEHRFKTIFSSAPMGMALHSVTGEFLETNAVYDDLFGYTPDMTLEDLVEMVEPESREVTLAAFNQIASGKVDTLAFEGAFKAASGRRVHAMVQLTLMPKPGSTPDQVVAQVVDVTELKETQARLEEQLTTKNQFLAAVSHELRTPLTAVIGLAELLREGDESFSREQRNDLINTIVDSGFDVANMVEDLLTAARQEAGQLKVVSVSVNMLAQTKQALEVINDGDGIRVRGDAPPATADPGRVRQILRNLLTNARKYGGDDIEVELDSVLGYARATVSDDGPGVPPEFADLIFGSYQRAHSDETHPGSVGIGLSISRGLAQQMGGDLVYRREDGRTRFELTLPIHRRLPSRG